MVTLNLVFANFCNTPFCILEAKYSDAVEQYTEAIFCDIPDEKKAVYLCNRSLASLRLEENQLALFDAVEAIKKDPNNVKGYYRKGQAQAAMN